jgi:hypothetical protein
MPFDFWHAQQADSRSQSRGAGPRPRQGGSRRAAVHARLPAGHIRGATSRLSHARHRRAEPANKPISPVGRPRQGDRLFLAPRTTKAPGAPSRLASNRATTSGPVGSIDIATRDAAASRRVGKSLQGRTKKNRAPAAPVETAGIRFEQEAVGGDAPPRRGEPAGDGVVRCLRLAGNASVKRGPSSIMTSP